MHVAEAAPSPQGVGRATAELFAKNGYNVVLAARNPEKLSEAKAQLSRHCAPGRACLGISTDITKGDAVDALVARVTNQCESVDILINCAGSVTPFPVRIYTAYNFIAVQHRKTPLHAVLLSMHAPGL